MKSHHMTPWHCFQQQLSICYTKLMIWVCKAYKHMRMTNTVSSSDTQHWPVSWTVTLSLASGHHYYSALLSITKHCLLAVSFKEKNQKQQPSEETVTDLRPVQVLEQHTLALGQIRGVIILQKGNRVRESSYQSISFSLHSSGRRRDAGRGTQSTTCVQLPNEMKEH